MEAVAAGTPIAGASASAKGAVLRVGLFLDAPSQPRWVVESFARVAASGLACFEVLAAANAHGTGESWLWTAYERLDRKAFASGPDETVCMPVASRLPASRKLRLPQAESGSQAVEAFRREVAALDLDVAFAVGEVDDALLDGLARHGVWRFAFGATLSQDVFQAGLREAIAGDLTTTSGLVERRADGSRHVLCRSVSRTCTFSPARSRDELLRKAAQFPLRALRNLKSGTVPNFRDEGLLENPGQSRVSEPGNPGLSRVLGRVARRVVEKATTVEQWFVAFAFGEAGADPADLERFVKLMPPKDRYWADPFPVVRGGRCYIFFEELMFATNKAHICVVEIDRSGRVSESRRVLECDYHLSYPFLVESGGELYMVPETAQVNRIEAWRSVEFPHRWEREKVLIDNIRAVDATFCVEGGRAWMFANVAPEGACLDDELHLFHADHLLGDWTPHPMNPVKSDARASRPAGRMFRRDGVLHRPAQVCVPRYGAGLVIHRIDRLDPEGFHEELVETILPRRPQGLLGLHTLNRAGDLCVVDGFIQASRFGASRA